MIDPDIRDGPVGQVWKALESVPDPEIPPLSVVDLGMIVDVSAVGDSVTVKLTPTFAACPALDVIRSAIEGAVKTTGFARVQVETVYDPPWTTERISEAGRRKLKEFGLAPPRRPTNPGLVQINLERVPCPYCDSSDTRLESTFGPTLCRSIHYCRACLQSFEHFKPVT